jgi:hypothetical protein
MLRSTLLLFAALVMTLSASAQNRLVLFEEHTGEGCGPCASTNPGLDSMIFKFSNNYKVCMIKYMSRIAGNWHFFDMVHAIDSQRADYFPTPFVPAGWIDGGYSFSSGPYASAVTQSAIDAAAAIPSPFIMSVSSMLNPAKDSITILVKIKALAPYSGSAVKLRIARCKSIDISPDAMMNGEKHVRNVVRDMFPDASGTTITSTWLPGDYQQYVVKGAVNKENFTGWYPSIKFTDSSVVAWIQDDNDKSVAQCAKENTWMGTPTADVDEIGAEPVHLSLHPNPANTTLHLDAYAAEARNASITISNIEGRILYNHNNNLMKGNNDVVIDVKDLSAGMYSLIVRAGGNVMHRAFTIVR